MDLVTLELTSNRMTHLELELPVSSEITTKRTKLDIQLIKKALSTNGVLSSAQSTTKREQTSKQRRARKSFSSTITGTSSKL